MSALLNTCLRCLTGKGLLSLHGVFALESFPRALCSPRARPAHFLLKTPRLPGFAENHRVKWAVVRKEPVYPRPRLRQDGPSLAHTIPQQAFWGSARVWAASVGDKKHTHLYFKAWRREARGCHSRLGTSPDWANPRLSVRVRIPRPWHWVQIGQGCTQ